MSSFCTEKKFQHICVSLDLNFNESLTNDIVSFEQLSPGYFENRIPALGAYIASQTTVLHMKRLNQTESPIFVILCVLCFQRQFFFYYYSMNSTPILFHRIINL